MRKVRKSLQAIVITGLVGMILPRFVEITGVSLIDKFLVKGLLGIAFLISTIIVGWLFSVHILKNKVTGGKTRTGIYFVLIMIMFGATTAILSFIKTVGIIVLSIFACITLVLLITFIIKLFAAQHETKITEKNTANQVIKANTDIKSVTTNKERKLNHPTPSLAVTPKNKVERQIKTAIELKTIYQLWNEKDPNKKCLTVTNDENPDLMWVKIYKPPYGNGKFYGYVRMNDARDTVNGEIFYADRQIWKLAD